MNFSELNHYQTCEFCGNRMKALGGEFAEQYRTNSVHWYCDKCEAHAYASAIDPRRGVYAPHEWFSKAEWEAWVNEL
jgi:ribosomal protein L24E